MFVHPNHRRLSVRGVELIVDLKDGGKRAVIRSNKRGQASLAVELAVAQVVVNRNLGGFKFVSRPGTTGYAEVEIPVQA